jgi:hypothetical protein
LAVVFLLFSLLFPTLSFSAETGNRWLLVFDTSSSMRSRSKGTEEVVRDLLMSGMHGQFHRGDTIGIWTFSDKLHASGEAPLQVWSPEMSQMIARHTLQYLDGLEYGRSANLQAVLTNMYNVMDSSDFITIVLFSDGEQSIKGTPFDDEINKRYKDNYRQQKKAGMPVVTVLQAKRGTIVTNTVNLGPWPAEIPTVPIPPKPVAPPQAAPKPEPQTAPPIIYDGRKSQSAAPDNSTIPVANNTAELTPPVVTQPTAAPVETPATPQATTAPPASPPVVAETAQPPATPPAEVVANNQSESKPAVAPVAPPAANESQPPPPPVETTSKPAAASPPVETAATVPLFGSRNLAIVSAGFAVFVCGLLLMAARHARKSQSSLITRSLDREQR